MHDSTNHIPLLVSENSGILIFEFNRPRVHHALNETMVRIFLDGLQKAQENPRIRLIRIQAKGPYFCAGADLAWMCQSSTEEAPEFLLSQLFHALDHCPKPTVAVLQGHVLGGGCGVVACCDLVLSIPDVQLCLPEVRLGLIPAVIAPYLIRRIGYSMTRAYGISGEWISAQQAHSIQWITEIVSQEHVDSRRAALEQTVLKNGPMAIRKWKQLLNELNPCACDMLTQSALSAIRQSSEAQEGIHAFMHRTPPRWWCAN